MASLFMARNGKLVTSPVTADILESITRDTVIELCRDQLHLTVEQREIDRTELYFADEIWLCGTGSEIIPVVSVDGYPVGLGSIGPITRDLLTLYEEVVRGNDNRYEEWLTAV